MRHFIKTLKRYLALACFFCLALSGTIRIQAESLHTTDVPPVPDTAQIEQPAPTLPPTVASPRTTTAPTVPNPRQTTAPVAKKRLPTVTGIQTIRYSTSSIKVTWKKTKNAASYKIYTSTTKNGTCRLAGSTRKNHFRIKGLRNNTTYYIRIQACADSSSRYGASRLSHSVCTRTKTYQRTTVFAGDSITTGLTVYKTVNKIDIGGNKKVTAAIGLNTVTFRTRRVFGGKSGLSRVISYKPYRIYMMLGINELHFRRADLMITQYENLVRSIKRASPQTDIVLLAVSPVTKTERARRHGFGQIPAFNKKLKQLAAKTGCRYYDYTAFLKNSDGFLTAKYSAGDGYHWNIAGYNRFAQIIAAYDKSLDE